MYTVVDDYPDRADDDPGAPFSYRSDLVIPDDAPPIDENVDIVTNEFSITIVLMGRDIIPRHLMPRLIHFARLRLDACSFSTERGFREDHLHIQGCCRVSHPADAVPRDVAKSLNAELARALGWVKPHRDVKARIKVVKLTEIGLHSWLGKCLSDPFSP